MFGLSMGFFLSYAVAFGTILVGYTVEKHYYSRTSAPVGGLAILFAAWNLWQATSSWFAVIAGIAGIFVFVDAYALQLAKSISHFVGSYTISGNIVLFLTLLIGEGMKIYPDILYWIAGVNFIAFFLSLVLPIRG